ncbi:hypothetical protein GCM10010245_36600 [Streptomyces spectabilis]|nr:hypothetical protein GCM10010245_36600 [Streptomyces spectabilis]
MSITITADSAPVPDDAVVTDSPEEAGRCRVSAGTPGNPVTAPSILAILGHAVPLRTLWPQSGYLAGRV